MTTFLLVAKAPIPGYAKTRLSPALTEYGAAALAAAALLDTVDAVSASARYRPVISLAGSLDLAVARRQIRRALRGWIVVDQYDGAFADRLVHAHRAAGLTGRPVIQIGMDTPQLVATDLADAAGILEEYDVGLGPTADGGWWVLARRPEVDPQVLTTVPMSTTSTHGATVEVFAAAGWRVGALPEQVDVDTAADARLVAELAPGTRFAELAGTLLDASARQAS